MTHTPLPTGSKAARPLSPHLQIYWPPINMVMSIVHRITGVALTAGTLLVVCWLTAAAMGPEPFKAVRGLYTGVFGTLILVGYTWALFHHMLGGLRHMVWDSGHGFALPTVDALSWGTLVGSVMLTAMVWLLPRFF